MAYGVVSGAGSDGPTGYTYAAVLVRDADRAEVHPGVEDVELDAMAIDQGADEADAQPEVLLERVVVLRRPE